jgi:hypothetical protein
MRDFILIGPVRFIHTRLDQDEDSPSYLNLTYTDKNLISSFEKYKDFIYYRPLDNYLSIQGNLEGYNIKKGYWIDVAPTSREIHLICSYFRNLKVFSVNLETFLIKFNAYNYNNDIFISTTMLFEQNNSGSMASFAKICVLSYLPVLNNIINFQFNYQNIIDILYVTLTMSYSIYNLYLIVHGISTQRKNYFKDFWNFIKMAQITFYCMSFLLRLFLFLQTKLNLKWIPYDATLDTYSICESYENVRIFEILTICFTLIYFLKYFDTNIIDPILKTLNKAFMNFVVFLCSYIFTMIGYGFFSNYIYGIYYMGTRF